MWIEPVIRGSRVQLYEYFKPGLTQIVLATGKPTCPRLVPFTSLSPYPFSNPPYFPYALVFLSPFPPHPSLCYRRARVFPRPRRRFSSFSHLSRRSTPLSLSSPVVNAVSVVSGRLYTYISPPASQLSVFSPLFGGAGTPAPIDSFPGNMKERVRRTWFIDFCFDERSTVSVGERMGYRKRYRRSEWNNYRGRNYPTTLLD